MATHQPDTGRRWKVTLAGAAVMKDYVSGCEIPADIAQQLPKGWVMSERVRPEEPTEPGAYLIDNKRYAVREKDTGDGYCWRLTGSNARFRWLGVYDWDGNPDATVARLHVNPFLPTETAHQVSLPLRLQGIKPSIPEERLSVTIDKAQDHSALVYMRIGTCNVWLTTGQALLMKSALNSILQGSE